MSKIFTIILPYPPTVNHAYGYSKNKVFVRKHVKEYKQKVKVIIKQQYPGWIPFFNPVSIKMIAYSPDRKKRDLDNLKKVLWDSLKSAGVLKDDSLIKEQYSRMLEGSLEFSKVILEIKEL